MNLKSFLILLLSVINLFLCFSLFAQEAKLVKQGEWGSGRYEHLVEINGYYYIKTSSNQIDVLNPELAGKDSLIGQITLSFEAFPDIDRLGKFKDYLVVVANEKLIIYSISNITSLNKEYSINVAGAGSQPISYQGNFLFFVDSDSKIFIIKEENDNFSIVKTINSQTHDHTEELFIYRRNLFVEDSFIYYWYVQEVKGVQSTILELYEIENFTLVNSGSLENFSLNGDVFHIENGHFIVSSFENTYLVNVNEGTFNVSNNLEGFNFRGQIKLTYQDNIIRGIFNSKLYSFYFSESNVISTLSVENLSSYFPSSTYPNYFKWVNGKLLGLSNDYGVFELILYNNLFEHIKFLYNQSGYVGKTAIKDNFIYLPRGSRIDVVDISDVENIFLYKTKTEKVNNILGSGDNYLFQNYFYLANYSLISSVDFELNSKGANTSTRGQVLQQGAHLFQMADDNGYEVQRYNGNSSYSLYESPLKIDFPSANDLCPQELKVVNNKLIAIDPCGNNKFHLFSNYINDDFSYNKSIEHGYSYWLVETIDEYIYFINPEGIDIVKLNDFEELETVTSIDIEFSATSGVYQAKILEDYLLISASHYFYLIDIKTPESPRVISKTKIENWEWTDGNIQLINEHVVVTTQHNGKVKFFQINIAPVAEVSTLKLNEDEELEAVLVFSDQEADSLTYTVIQQASLGTASIDINGLVYIPNENMNGEDTVIIKAEDEHGNFIEHEISVIITPINDAPEIITERFTIDEDAFINAKVAAEDIDGDELTFNVVTEAKFGHLTISEDGLLNYQPNSDFLVMIM